MLGNFVFDIDGAMAIMIDSKAEKVEKEVRDKFGDVFWEKHCLMAKYPHYIFPGYYALFKWLHINGGKIFFFSSGLEIRNVELAAKMMEKAFGEAVSEVPYKVFSRQHCVDTSSPYWAPPNPEAEKYKTFFHGQRKKVLAGIVVPEEEIANTLLIDDDTSYMVKGEEYNFISLRYAHEYLHDGYRNDGFTHFHPAYYLAGLFSTLFDLRETKGMTLVEAAKFVQIDSEGAVLSRDFFYPSRKKIDFYLKGHQILSQIDPTLGFYYELPQGGDEEDD